MLDSAPMSAASMTFTPTAKPANASLIPRSSRGFSGVFETMSASAKKSIE